MGAGDGWVVGRFQIATTRFLRVVSVVAAGSSKAARGWRMAVLKSRTA